MSLAEERIVWATSPGNAAKVLTASLVASEGADDYVDTDEDSPWVELYYLAAGTIPTLIEGEVLAQSRQAGSALSALPSMATAVPTGTEIRQPIAGGGQLFFLALRSPGERGRHVFYVSGGKRLTFKFKRTTGGDGTSTWICTARQIAPP
jgi:hypothetical protein